MAVFTPFRGRRSPSVTAVQRELPESVRQALPIRFEAVAEALALDADVVAACSVVGRDVACDGASLGEALSGLRATYRLVRSAPPEFHAAEALAVAWSEATLEYLHDLSCEDPLTGLASLAHLRTRLDEIYRDAELTGLSVHASHALVIVALVVRDPQAPADQPFMRALRLVQVTEAMRAVYSGGQTLARLGGTRAVALVPRTVDLGASVAVLRGFLTDMDLGGADLRVWIEGLPPSVGSASRLLDDLAR